MTNDIGVKLDVAANAAAMKALRLHWKEGEIYQSIYSTRTIKAGEVIEGSALEVRFGSLHSIESDSFISSKQQLVGRLALNEIPPGQQVSVDDLEPAEQYFQRLLGFAEAALGPRSFEVARLLNLMADSYWNNPRFARLFDCNAYVKAIQLNKRALAIHEELCGTHSREVLEDCLTIAMVSRRLEQFNESNEAEEFLTRALDAYETLKRSIEWKKQDDSSVLDRLASHYSEHNDSVLMKKFLQRAIAAKEQTFCQSLIGLCNRLQRLADLECEQGNFSEAEQLHQRLVAMIERNFGSTNIEVAPFLEAYAKFLQDRGRTTEGQGMIARAEAIKEVSQ